MLNQSAVDATAMIGIDLGGTNLNIGKVVNGELTRQRLYHYDASADEQTIVDFICRCIENKLDDQVSAIGIGVPSVVDVAAGVVYEAANIPAWREVPLKELLEQRFSLPVAVNNDVNCFVLGEREYGAAQGLDHVVGVCLGTGLGVGLVINGKLYSGNTCGAGELGEIRYRQGILENYCSGQYFKRYHATTGEAACKRAAAGDSEAQALFDDFGEHVGHALSTALLAYDPQMIVLGGSVSRAYPYFRAGMERVLAQFPFQQMLSRCRIELGTVQNAAILGACALHRSA